MNNKQFIGLITVLVVGFSVLGFLTFHIAKAPVGKLGSGVPDSLSYGGLTGQVANASTTCGANTSTLIVGIQSGRTSFSATNDAATKVYLCQATSNCNQSTGKELNANGGYFEQTDGYIGGYSCNSSATSTLTTTNSQ